MILAALAILQACNGPLPTREESDEKYSRVLIFVGEGFNSLSSYVMDDIDDLAGVLPNPDLPFEHSNKALVMISHLTERYQDYSTPTSPYIIRISRDYLGRPIRDTLLTLDKGMIMTKSENLRFALEYVRDNFPSDSYGMILNSHGTGWLPAGVYDSGQDEFSMMSAHGKRPEGAVPYREHRNPDGIDVKSFGQEVIRADGSTYSFEMTLPSLAAAIPMKMDYMIFDACLMGGIETAYELRNVTDKVAFSQAEVLADGFCYDTILSRLLNESPVNLHAVCEDYFNHYNERTGVYQSATISLIDCTRLDHLAECCNALFEEYRDRIASLPYKEVQGFFRYNKHWFFDLEDILVKAGMNSSQRRELTSALQECVLYQANTKSFMEDFDIKTCCGFSMYLPSAGSSYLNSYYTELEWNKATGLVD